MSEIKNDIIAALAYFDIFNYPVTQREIFLFLGNVYNQQKFQDQLNSLVLNRIIFKLDEFYSLQNNQKLAQRRRKGNKKAQELIETAEKVASLLSCFPYVRGVAISGSLSKNFADENSDIDLFIITAKNRLWIARTLMHIFKKFTFLVNKQHLFCMNYYVSEDGLEIVEKNLYTAVEIATLMPLQGDIAFENFYAANSWITNYLPNHFMRISTARKLNRGWLKMLMEAFFNNRLGSALNKQLMKITADRWLKKTRHLELNSHGIVMSMDAAEQYAKPHPDDFQQQFITIYKDKVDQLLRKYQAHPAY